MELRPRLRGFGAAAIAAFALATPLAAAAQPSTAVSLTRLDCGNEPEPMKVADFSDTFAFESMTLQLTYSCYLIHHGDAYMIWDAGNAPGDDASAPRKSLVALLAQLDLSPGQIRFLGISHDHFDHIGQAASFPQATLLIGKADWEEIATQPPRRWTAEDVAMVRRAFAPWLNGGKVEQLDRSRKDVFGDGSVVMISTPGHTPGHHVLLVRLARTGNVLLSGDLTHFRENYAVNGVPTWNFNRADTLASLDLFKQMENSLRATVIIQHDPRDIARLPAFPAAAQ